MGQWTLARLALAAAVVTSGCEARLILGAGCTQTSECPASLVCVAARCRNECTTARDCPRGAICLHGDGGTAACQLLGEGGDTCTASSECGGRLVCLEARCTEDCSDDAECLAGAVCDPSAGCVECSTDADCPRTLRCGASHGCTPECTTDGDCATGLVCVAERCALPGADAGLTDAARVPVMNDRCEDALTVPLPAAPFVISYRARGTGWDDDTPSCSPDPDGFVRFEAPARTLIHVGCGGPAAGANALAPIASCSASDADCGQRDYQHAHHVVPDATLFAMDVDSTDPDLWLCLEGFALGADTLVFEAPEGLVDLTVVLDGRGAGMCGSAGPDAFIFGYMAGGGGTMTLVAEAPGVELVWADAREGCDPAATSRTEITLPRVAGFNAQFAYVRLVAPGATGPVTVHLTGSVTPG